MRQKDSDPSLQARAYPDGKGWRQVLSLVAETTPAEKAEISATALLENVHLLHPL